VSEQDFFFDEEPESKTPAPKTAPKSARPAGAAKATPVVEAAPSSSSETTWAVASLLGVIGLLHGCLLRLLVSHSPAPAAAAVPAPTTPAATSPSSGTPSTLTSEQINSGQLPAGHPPINASGTANTAPAP